MSTRDPSGRPITPDEPLEELRRVLATRVRSEPRTAECVDDDTIAALAAGTLDPGLRAPVLVHVAQCGHCRAAVASVARALADADVAREVAALEGPRRRPRYWIALPAAAAAAVLLLVWPRPADDRGGHRGSPGVSAPVPVSPLGTVAEATTLRWSAVAGVDQYRVTVFDADGRVLYERMLADTVAALPDSVALAPGQPYLWEVAARVGWGRWSASPLVEFSIAGGRGPP